MIFVISFAKIFAMFSAKKVARVLVIRIVIKKRIKVFMFSEVIISCTVKIAPFLDLFIV